MALFLLLGAGGGAIRALAQPVQGEWPDRHLTLFYRKEAPDAPGHLDPAVTAVTMALEQQFQSRQYQLTQPAPDVYEALDDNPNVRVSFAPDAGLTLIYSVHTSERPGPGVDISILGTEVDARVFMGATILSTEQSRGQIQIRTDPSRRDYALRAGQEAAARDAARLLVSQVEQRLKSYSPEQIAAMKARDSRPGIALVSPPEGVSGSRPGASPPGETMVPGRRWLLAAAVANYSHVRGANDLEGTIPDVMNVRDTLALFGFGEDTRTVLIDEQATEKAVRGKLADLAAKAGPDDIVVVYISGHGAQKPYALDGTAQLMFYDTGSGSSGGGIDAEELAMLLLKIKARQLVLLLDTCYSGWAASHLDQLTMVVSPAGLQPKLAGGAPDIARFARVAASSFNAGFAIMTAARPYETSLDLGAKVGGLFTSNLMRSIRDSHGAVSIERLYKEDVWPSVVKRSQELKSRMHVYCKAPSAQDGPPSQAARGLDSLDACQQSPVLGYMGTGNQIALGAPVPGAAAGRDTPAAREGHSQPKPDPKRAGRSHGV